VVLRSESAANPEALRLWVNDRLGRTQRISQLIVVDELPRSSIGKVLKRELRDRYRPPV
jgi:acyl-CoA synthetase (AMP-forming)/AMP-acid ligase II